MSLQDLETLCVGRNVGDAVVLFLPMRMKRILYIVEMVTGRAVHRGGGAEMAVAPQRKLNLQFLFYFKYIGQDKSCLIFKYIGALRSFAPP